MLRKFTKDVGRNFTAGMLRDYPLLVWRNIARDAGESMEKFSVEIKDERMETLETPLRTKRK